MKPTGGYPANRRRVGAANMFTPALNNITGSKPAKGPSLVFTPSPSKKSVPKGNQFGSPKYKPSNGKGVSY